MVRRRKTCMKPELFNKVWLLHERWQLQNLTILQFALLFVCKGTNNIARFLKNIWRRAILILTINKSRFPAIVLRSDGEVNPIAPASIPFYQQFVIVLSGLIRIVHQDHRISHCLLYPIHPDIHCAPRQVIARRRASHLPVHLRTPIATTDNNRLFGILFPS